MTARSLVLPENPLAEYVELPANLTNRLRLCQNAWLVWLVFHKNGLLIAGWSILGCLILEHQICLLIVPCLSFDCWLVVVDGWWVACWLIVGWWKTLEMTSKLQVQTSSHFPVRSTVAGFSQLNQLNLKFPLVQSQCSSETLQVPFHQLIYLRVNPFLDRQIHSGNLTPFFASSPHMRSSTVSPPFIVHQVPQFGDSSNIRWQLVQIPLFSGCRSSKSSEGNPL